MNIKKILNKIKNKVCKKKAFYPQVIDLREISDNPKSWFYYNCPILINAKTILGISLEIFSLGEKTFNPWVIGLEKAVKSDKPIEVLNSYLEQYYKDVTPNSLSEYYGLEAISPFCFLLPQHRFMPWDNISNETIEKFKEERKKTAVLDWPGCGLLSKQKVQDNALRLYNLACEIEKKGYLRNDSYDGDILAVVLYKNQNDWRWFTCNGTHRACVARALHLQTVPIRVTKLVCRDDVEIWPCVKSGICNRETALKIFDMVFDNKLPPVFERWCERILNAE